jgi:membrane protease YdiL (CAAX protease family)
MLVIPFAGTALIGAILVLLWARFSRTSWREIGYVRPKSWIHILAVGIAFGVAFKFLMKTMVMPLLGANPINQAYHYIAGNPAAVLQMAVFVIVGAGFGEETVYRGFLFERFGKLFGTGLGAKGLTVLLTSIWFGQVHHADQGMAGAEQAAIMGLVFGAVFAITGRIFMLMFAHAAFDLTALAMIYWNVETKVAHLVFK